MAGSPGPDMFPASVGRRLMSTAAHAGGLVKDRKDEGSGKPRFPVPWKKRARPLLTGGEAGGFCRGKNPPCAACARGMSAPDPRLGDTENVGSARNMNRPVRLGGVFLDGDYIRLAPTVAEQQTLGPGP